MVTKTSSATGPRSLRSLILMQQFAAKEIGSRIAQARRERGGVTQEELAELLNISTRSVQDYEAGVTIPWRHFQQMALIFERPMEWFLHGDGAAPSGPAVDEAILERLDSIEELVGLLVKAVATQPAEAGER